MLEDLVRYVAEDPGVVVKIENTVVKMEGPEAEEQE